MGPAAVALAIMQMTPGLLDTVNRLAGSIGGFGHYNPMDEIEGARKQTEEDTGKANELASKLDKGELSLDDYNNQLGNLMGIQGGASAAAADDKNPYDNAALDFKAKAPNFSEKTKSFIASGYFDPNANDPGWYKTMGSVFAGINEPLRALTGAANTGMQTGLMYGMLNQMGGLAAMFPKFIP
jgi:hypothetical protein